VTRVLVVDDSALVRQTMLAILGQEGFEVAIAADPIIAEDRMKHFTPDVILLDLEMPRMDGLSFLRKLMAERPTPVVVLSAVVGRGTEQSMRALQEGALDVVAKPQLGVRDFLYESAILLGDAIRGAATARLPARRPAIAAAAPMRRAARARGDASPRVIAMGASTGGTEALRTILVGVDEETPGIVIVQHMPRHFTNSFARSLDLASRIEVREAVSGDRIARGVALVAPGDSHLLVERRENAYVVRVADGPLVSRHRPSVDVLFRSVAAAAGPNGVGVLLTGMGADGADGLAEMRKAGAMTIAQDESTAIVFGMPREAILRGAAERVLPLDEISQAIAVTERTTGLRTEC